MEKNETQFYDSINQITNSFIKLKCEKSRNEAIRKYNFSRNSFLKNQTSSSIYSYKNYLISNNSETNSNKNEVLFKSDINSISNRKTSFRNSNKFDKIFLRRIKLKNNKNKFIGTKSLDIKNNYNIVGMSDKTKMNKRKIDFIKYKFLLGQKNYYKNLFHQNDISFSSYYSKKINPFFKKNSERLYIDKDKLKKLFLRKEEQNILTKKDFSEYLSIYSFKNKNKINKKSDLRTNNYNEKKMKENNINDKLNYNKENKIYNKPNEIKEIIDDNYNEYLKDISSSDSNKSKIETTRNKNFKNQKVLKQKSKSLKYKLSLNFFQKEIKQYKKRINKYNNSNVTIKNNNNLLDYRKPFTNRMKLEDISKCITIENPILRKKLILEKGALK